MFGAQLALPDRPQCCRQPPDRAAPAAHLGAGRARPNRGYRRPGDPEGDAGGRRLVQQLLATIHRLAPADQQVMLLYLEDLTAEIGEVTGAVFSQSGQQMTGKRTTP